MTKSTVSSSRRSKSKKIDPDAALWQRFNEIKNRKKTSSLRRRKVGGFCQFGQIACQLLSFWTAIAITAITYVRLPVDEIFAIHITHCCLDAILLAFSVMVVMNSRRAMRELLVSLFMGAIFWDTYLLTTSLRGHLDLICTAKEQNEAESDCYGYFKLHHHLIYLVIEGLCYHAVGLLFAGTGMSLLSRADRDYHEAVVMQATLEERRRNRKRLKSSRSKKSDSRPSEESQKSLRPK